MLYVEPSLRLPTLLRVIGVHNDVNITVALFMVGMNFLFNSLTTYLNLLADDINAVVYQCAMSVMGMSIGPQVTHRHGT